MSCASLLQLWNIQIALLIVFQQTPTCTCLLIKPDEDHLWMRIFCEHKIVLFHFTWKTVLITQILITQCNRSNLPLSYFTKQHRDRRENAGSWCKCSESCRGRGCPSSPPSTKAMLLLTKDVDSGGAVGGARHAAGHAGVIPPVLQPNPLQVQAAVAAHAHVRSGNQLPKERWNLSLGKYILTVLILGLQCGFTWLCLILRSYVFLESFTRASPIFHLSYKADLT